MAPKPRHVRTLFDRKPKCPRRWTPAYERALDAGLGPVIAREVAMTAVRLCRQDIDQIVHEFKYGDDAD